MTDQEQEALRKLAADNCRAIEPIPTEVDAEIEPLEEIRGVVFDIYGTVLVSGVGDIGLTDDEKRDPPLAEAISAGGLELNTKTEGLFDEFKQEILAQQQAEKGKREELEYPEVEIREVWDVFLHRLAAENRLSGDITLRRIAEISLRYELAVNPVSLMPGFVELMQHLKENGIPVGIISNAQFFTPLTLEALLETDLKDCGFDLYTSVWSYLEREAKPSTRLYKTAAEKWDGGYGLPPENLLYIGNDMRNDIAPAHHCDFRTVLFAGDRRSLRLREDDPCTHGVKPDRTITSLEQIKQLIA